MRSVWEIVGPIGLVGGAFIVEDRLGPHLTVVLQLVIIFWALNNTMDMNAWHRRNLIFAARVETQFLRDADYGAVIPSSFREPKTDWVEFYTINFWTFLVLLAVVVAYYLLILLRVHPSSPCLMLGPLAVLLVGSIATARNHVRCENQIDRYFRETQGQARGVDGELGKK